MASPPEPSALIGRGVLRDARGEVLLNDASYRLLVRADGSVGALQPIEGAILNPPVPWGFPLTAIGAHVVLDLADGRHWDCVLADHEGRLRSRVGGGHSTTGPRTPRLAHSMPRILVVDDEPSNLVIAQRFLEGTRYAVKAVSSGAEALQTIEELGSFDLYILDVMMPGMLGTDLAELIRQREPAALVLYFTAYADALFSGKRTLREREAFIQKPAGRREFLEAISLMLYNDLRGPRDKT